MPRFNVAPFQRHVPVILSPEDFDAWLEPRESLIAQELVRTYPADKLQAQLVSTRVNSPKNDNPAVIEPTLDPR